MNCQDYLTFHYLNFWRDSLLLKILLILTIAQDLQIFRKRPCGNQVNTVYTNGICCVKLFPAWQPPCNWRCDALLWVWRIIKNHFWVQCKSLCLPQGHGERRLTPAPSLASEPSQVHGPDGCLSSIANPPAPTKPKTFIAHGRIRMAERLLCFEWIRFSRHPLSPAWCFVSVVKECRKATKIMTDKYLCQLETALRAAQWQLPLRENARGAKCWHSVSCLWKNILHFSPLSGHPCPYGGCQWQSCPGSWWGGGMALVTPRQLPSLWLLCAHLCCCAEGVPVFTPFPAWACPVSRRSQRTFHHFCASKGRTNKST